MPRWSQSLLIAALGLACALPAMAQWKWKDKDGRTQYSDVPPPPGVKEADILQRPNGARRAPAAEAEAPAAAPAAASGAAAAKVDPELEARRKKTEELEAAKKKEVEQKNAAIRKDNCTQARNYMKSLEDGMRISRTTSSGEREILDDAGRAEEVKRTRAIITSDCAK
jgi:hypothetical protein